MYTIRDPKVKGTQINQQISNTLGNRHKICTHKDWYIFLYVFRMEINLN